MATLSELEDAAEDSQWNSENHWYIFKHCKGKWAFEYVCCSDNCDSNYYNRYDSLDGLLNDVAGKLEDYEKVK